MKYVEETFYRNAELGREPRTLAAPTYNLALILLKRAAAGCLFVPIRSMQYLAVLDSEEFIFVDREGRRLIEVAWQAFRPHDRAALGAPVPYEAVYYSTGGAEIMRRLHGEFLKALREAQDREPQQVAARVLSLARARP